MDILDLGRSNGKNRYALVIVDHFSKWVVAEPVPNKTLKIVAQIFVEKFIFYAHNELIVIGVPSL
jgi:hypothetical protein